MARSGGTKRQRRDGYLELRNESAGLSRSKRLEIYIGQNRRQSQSNGSSIHERRSGWDLCVRYSGRRYSTWCRSAALAHVVNTACGEIGLKSRDQASGV